jgi:hypothetical protein
MTPNVFGIEDLMSIEVRTLGIISVILTIEVIGILQWLKNFIKCKKKKTYAFLSLFLLLPCAYMYTPLVSPLATAIFTMVFLPLAIIQMAYEVIVQKIPQAVSGFIDKLTGRAADVVTGTGSPPSGRGQQSGDSRG